MSRNDLSRSEVDVEVAVETATEKSTTPDPLVLSRHRLLPASEGVLPSNATTPDALSPLREFRERLHGRSDAIDFGFVPTAVCVTSSNSHHEDWRYSAMQTTHSWLLSDP
jgi:hypothetical protein